MLSQSVCRLGGTHAPAERMPQRTHEPPMSAELDTCCRAFCLLCCVRASARSTWIALALQSSGNRERSRFGQGSDHWVLSPVVESEVLYCRRRRRS